MRFQMLESKNVLVARNVLVAQALPVKVMTKVNEHEFPSPLQNGEYRRLLKLFSPLTFSHFDFFSRIIRPFSNKLAQSSLWPKRI